MKVLWICNLILPEIAKKEKLPIPVSGGWITGLSNALITDENIHLSVAFPLLESKKISGVVGKINYSSFAWHNINRYSDSIKSEIANIISEVNPDIIHIFGTEFPHTLAAMNAAKEVDMLNKVVVSIQGLVSVYAQHYYANLPHSVLSKYTLRDFLKRDNIIKQKKAYEQRGEYELASVNMAKYIIGRTDWDKACVQEINYCAKYYHCNETLRNVFYESIWSINRCERNSIFVSQSNYPIKGFHIMIDAFESVLKKYPDAHLYTTGNNPCRKKSICDYLHQTYYEKYISSLINKKGLKDKITFLGTLSEQEMKERMICSHVFVLCSSIENSPNSLGEAMLLGVPSVASDVGGVKNLLNHEKEGFIFPFDEPYMLSYYIKQILGDDDLATNISNSCRKHALITHSPEYNNNQLLSIYRDIYCENN